VDNEWTPSTFAKGKGGERSKGASERAHRTCAASKKVAKESSCLHSPPTLELAHTVDGRVGRNPSSEPGRCDKIGNQVYYWNWWIYYMLNTLTRFSSLGRLRQFQEQCGKQRS
jgi:hypothetical protein